MHVKIYYIHVIYAVHDGISQELVDKSQRLAAS